MTFIKTKILYLSVVFIFIGFHHTSAQKFTLGLLGGAHGYKVSFEDKGDRAIYKSKPKLGYRAGVYILFPLENEFSWSTEMYYSKKGRKIEIGNSGMVNDADYTFIELSVLLRKAYKVRLSEGFTGKWFFNVGPNVNYWLNGKGTIDAGVDLDYKVKFEDGTGDLEYNYIVDGNRYLFGLDFGIGVEVPLIGNQSIQAEMRFTLGQTFLGSKDGSIPVNNFQVDDNIRSNYRVISFILRYGFDFDIQKSKKGKSTIKRPKRRKF